MTLSILFACLMAPAVRPQTYSLLPPDMAARLGGAKDSPAAKSILRSADGDLAAVPHPMARIHMEGTLQGQGIRDESQAAVRDFTRMQDLAFAYRLTGDRRYLNQVARLLGAWVAVYAVSGNPIDETSFTPMFVAFDLTKADLDPQLTSQTTALFRSFATNYLDWLDANFAKDPYNWSSHRVKLAVLGAYECNDRDLIARAHLAYTRQVKQNLRDDGSVKDFYKRDALHYVVYDLEPLTIADMAAKAHGEDWFHTAAAGSPSVEQAVDWLVPYATGEKTHEEFVHSIEPFDAARARAGEKGFAGVWEPRSSIALLAQCGYLDRRYLPRLNKVVADTKNAPPVWIVLMTLAAQ